MERILSEPVIRAESVGQRRLEAYLSGELYESAARTGASSAPTLWRYLCRSIPHWPADCDI